MRRILAALALSFAVAVQAETLQERLGYAPGAKLLIVHADDLGMAHSVNAASLRALDTGLVNSASIMIPCPWLPEIVDYAKLNPNADLGLHLTLTSEWTSFRWGPLLSRERVPTLYDGEGYLYLTESEAAKKIDARQAEAEIRAQIARARALGIVPTHLDSHMGTLYQTKELFQALMRVAREERIPARVSRAHLQNPFVAGTLRAGDIVIDHIISIGSDVPASEWSKWYTEAIRNMKPGVTEVIVHLAYDTPEMRGAAVNHPHWGSEWRQRDFDYFTSDYFRTVLRENDVRLITWRDLARLIND